MPPGTQPSLNCRHPARQYTSSLPLHSLASGPWIWWQGLPLSQAAGTLAPSAITSRTSRKTDGAMEAWDGGGGGRPSPTPTWLAWLWQGVTMVASTALAYVLCCLVLVCLLLLWTRQRALPFALESYRCLNKVRASRCPAGHASHPVAERAACAAPPAGAPLARRRLHVNSFSGVIPQELPTPSTECSIGTTRSYQCPLPDSVPALGAIVLCTTEPPSKGDRRHSYAPAARTSTTSSSTPAPRFSNSGR